MAVVNQKQDTAQQRTRRAGTRVFALLAFIIAVVLASRLGSELTWLDRQTWSRQPGLWTAMAIVGMLVFGSFYGLALWRNACGSRLAHCWPEIIQWARGIEYVVWFIGYVLLVREAGYLPASVVFCCTLTWRLGYRSYRAICAAAVFAVFTVVIFKSLLGVQIPAGAAYDHLPTAIRGLMIRYF